VRILITGFSGFVSHHFLDFLEKQNEKFTVLGTDKNIPSFDYSAYKNLKVSYTQANLLDKEVVKELLEFRPDYLLHLASFSSVGSSWSNPVESFTNNLNIFLNLIDQIRINNVPCRVLSIGSSEEFGNVSPDELPLNEEKELKPVSPYAVARVSQEMLSKIYADGYGLDIVLTRSFNHIGPGQKDIFVISSFAKQLVQIADGKIESKKLITGDISIIRDFVDVRDVVRAYYLLLQKGRRGGIYNICSGNGISLGDIINKMCSQLHIQVQIERDESRVRPMDNKIIIGSNSKIKNELGWKPEIGIEESLKDIISYWKLKLNQQQPFL
jgi:GDP-4-dehydro-6-deoxy-D-mannose reductase